MIKKYKKLNIHTLLLGGVLFVLLISGTKVLAADINYSNFKNTLYNFLNEQCPTNWNIRQTQCLVSSVFTDPLDIYNYKTKLYGAKSDDEIELILSDFFLKYCTPQYTSTTNFQKQASAKSLNFFCNCWYSPNENCANLVNSLGSQFPPGSTSGSGAASITNIITNYEAGQELGQKLKKDTSCQSDLNLGLLNFFHNPLSWFLRLIFWIFEQLLEFLADVFMWILTPKNFGGFVNFPPVQTIWKTARDLANIGIILGFVFVAIATILKIEKYSWEKMLWRLVLVALLINFSLVLCGIFVDLSNFLTTYFVTGAGSQVFKFKDILTNTASSIACAGYNQGFIYESGTALLGIIVIIVFLGQVAGLILYATIRVVTLWITLGLSPLFLLSLAFPGLEKLADSWKNYFTQAIISLPIIAFSLFIVLVMLNEVALNFEFAKGDFWKTIVSLISFGIIIIILSQAILVIAGALGIQNIRQGYKVVTKLAWGALGLAGGAAFWSTARKMVSSKFWEDAATKLEKSSNRFLYSIGRTMRETKTKLLADRIKKDKDYLDTLNEEQTRNYIAKNIKNPDLVALGVNRLKKLGKLSIEKKKQDVMLVDIASKSGYFEPPSEIRKTNWVVWANSSLIDKKISQKNSEITVEHIASTEELDVLNEDFKKLSFQDQVNFDVASKLKFSEIENNNWDDIWEHYLSKLPEEQSRAFLFALTMSQGPKLAPISGVAREHRLNIGKAIVDSVHHYLTKKYGKKVTRDNAKDFLLEDEVIIESSTGQLIKIKGKGWKTTPAFSGWIKAC